ncbi:unnamed protein product (mitochondrion) [Plasmodiophora brassicae]|uniref:VWFA domain-containing protein n=1 Tax=Plasmodiophora brassicae TaxID=37360 RepID=A0A3P3YBL0_PLABS|nr:unnamed protein product [Plasmodiophora brassicae]
MSSFQETQDCLRTPSSRLAKSSTPPTDADAGDAPFEEAVSHAIVFGARAHDAVCRAQFHLSILGKLVHPEPEATCSDSFRIALLCDGDGRAVAHGRVMPTTQVHFVSASYNCVIILDMSTSMASALAEAGSGSVSLDRAFACVTQIVKILIACADYIPHDPSAASSSRILLSIIACDHSNVLRSILHGWPLARDHLPELLRIIDKRLSSLENELSHVHPDPSSNDASFMLASMLLTHDRLPGDRAPISFFVTDGVLTAPDIGTFDNVFTSIAAKDIAVHTVLLHRHSGHFGFIPDPDFLVMISQYSGGVHLSASDLDAFDLRTRESLFGGSYSPLLLRQSALCKSALPFISGAPCSEPTNWGGPLFCLKIKEYLLDVSIGSLLLCRIKEGFKCGQTTNLKGGGFSLSMTLVWKPIVTVDYVIEKRLHENPRVIVKVIAPDEFLRRLQILQKSKKNRGPVMTINSGVAAPPPLVLLERLTNLVKTDQLLILLHSLRPDDITGSTLSTLRQRGEPDLRLVRSLSGTGRNASERSFSASQPPQESPALLKIIAMPPTSWKRWFSVTRLDFFCTSRCRDKKKHRSSCTDFDSNKDIIHAALTTWSSSVHGNLYVKLLAARESLAPQNELDIHLWSAGASKPLPICLARIFWHSNILASLYVGVFTVGGAQADVEIAHIKTLIANCRPSGSGSESEPWIVFPSTPLSPVLLKLDPSDAVFRNDVKRVKFPLESAPLNGNAFVELPSSVSLNTTLLARSRSNPNLASLGMSREVSPVSAAGSSSTTKPPSPQHNDPSRESVESSLPKSVLRSFMYSAQRTYRTQNTEMLRCFFAHINDARHRDGFDLLFADELSFTYCFEISLPTGVSANLQYAVCLVSSVDVLVEVWLDPLDTAEVSCRSLFQTIMDYFDKSDKLTLQSLQVFHSIQDAHRNNVLSLRGSRRVEQIEDFRVQEFPFDILPLMRNARPCFVPLRFPHGLAVSQTCVLESLCRIPSIVEVVPGACFAQVVDRKTVTLALLTADVDTSVASLASDVKSLMAYAKEILDRLCGDADRRESENIVLIFEVALEDILDSKSELRNVVANLIKSGASAIESNAVYQHECHHSSALNMLRDLIEHLHSIYFAQEVFSNLSHGSNVSDDDVNAVVSSLVDYSNHINITSVICNGADYQAMSASLDKIIRECLRAVTSSSDDWATPTYFIFVDGNEFHNDDAADTDDDSDDLAPNVSRAGSRAEHLLDPSIPDAVPFCMRFEVVVRSDDRVLATIPISSGSSSSAAFDQARQSARDAAQDGTAPVVFMRITCCTFRFREWESYRFGVDPDVSTGLRKSTSMSALSSASTSPISMRRLKLGGFSVLPEPLSKQMARISKQIRSMFADQVLRNLQKQLGTNWSPDNVTEELLTDIQLHMGRLRDTHKLQKRIPIDFVSPGLATASMFLRDDFAFVYNFDERFDVSKQLGNGLAMIFCSLLDESGRVVRAVKPFNNSRDEDVQETLNNPVTIEDIACREGGISVMDSTVVTGIWDYTSKRIAISMEIWMLGAVNIEMLVDLFSQSFKQALSDFRIEWAWNRFDRTPTGSLDMLLVHGQTIENPTVSVTSFGFHLPSYCLASVVKEMVSMITPVCECQVAMSSQENSWVFVPDVSTMTMRHPQVVRIVGRGTGSNEHVLRDNIIGLECAYSGSVAKEAVTHKRCSFVIVTIQRRSIRIVTYNWRPNYTAQLTKQTARLASWTQFRLHLLEAVLHQKLGLFNHVPCHPPAVSKEPVSSKDPPSTVHARFTVDNIATLVEHEVPPRHQIHETSQHLTSPTDLPTVSHHRGGRGRIPNRFEVRRRSQKVGSPMGSSVPFSSVLRGALPDTSVKLHADPVYQHGQAFLAVAKRLKEVGDSEARREFCTILCETSSGPSSASSAMQLVWIDFTVSNATFLQSCTLPFMFLSETGDAKSPSSWSETFIGQFLSHLQSTSGVSSLLGAIQSPGHHRHLLRRCLEPGKILLIEVLVNPDAATCATHIFDSVTETSSEAAFSTISELTRDIAFEPFMEMFHERFIIDKAQTITHPDFSFFRTLMALSSPSSPYRNVQVASAKGTCELLDLLFSSGDLVPIPSPKPDGFMTRSDGICMLIFRTDPNEVATFCFRRAVCDDLSKLAAQFLNDLLHTCLVRQSASLLWNRLSSNMETSISLTPSEAEAFLQVFDRKDLVDFDPSLGRLLQRVRMVDSELFISEIRSSFRGRCCDLTVSGQPAYLVLCLPKPSDAALFVHVADPYRLEVCARDRSNEHHDQMRSLVIDYVNAACYLLWKMCIPE